MSQYNQCNDAVDCINELVIMVDSVFTQMRWNLVSFLSWTHWFNWFKADISGSGTDTSELLDVPAKVEISIANLNFA